MRYGMDDLEELEDIDIIGNKRGKESVKTSNKPTNALTTI